VPCVARDTYGCPDRPSLTLCLVLAVELVVAAVAGLTALGESKADGGG